VGLKGFSSADINRLVLHIRQTGEKASSAALQVMREEGNEIKLLAQEFAPYDEGKLEAAIKVETTDRDSRGRFARKEVKVFVDPNMPGSGGAETVGQYAWYIHENLDPAGSLHLGERSAIKDGGRGVVGGKFLERAYNQRRSLALRRITIAVKSALGS
jgi:hypothetical protein